MNKQIVLDTNFILTCVKQKIQMFEQLEELFGIYDLIVGEQVLSELSELKNQLGLKTSEKEAASVALKLLKAKKIKIVDFNSSNVDTGIVFYAMEKPHIIIATLDRELKNRILRRNKLAKFLTILKKKRIGMA